ncbi:hypothetical protein B0H13DRAFT_1852430 [Mycena leptocephala]|nr:hypothetical protein B0H13DRAFT_1852430 [Mycena leptocephala]
MPSRAGTIACRTFRHHCIAVDQNSGLTDKEATTIIVDERFYSHPIPYTVHDPNEEPQPPASMADTASADGFRAIDTTMTVATAPGIQRISEMRVSSPTKYLMILTEGRAIQRDLHSLAQSTGQFYAGSRVEQVENGEHQLLEVSSSVGEVRAELADQRRTMNALKVSTTRASAQLDAVFNTLQSILARLPEQQKRSRKRAKSKIARKVCTSEIPRKVGGSKFRAKSAGRKIAQNQP